MDGLIPRIRRVRIQRPYSSVQHIYRIKRIRIVGNQEIAKYHNNDQRDQYDKANNKLLIAETFL